MNKILNINLGGYPFTIDDDAYDHLSTYLNTIHNHFRDSEGYEEITGDIESRMAELFQETTANRPIITLTDVQDAIAIMGTPEDFGAETATDMGTEEPAPKSKSRKGSKKDKTLKTGKRLFRDPDDEVIGGVASGVAAYLGIQDPLWVRLAFLIIAFGFGFGIVFYLVLWAIVPRAETASDRLAMRGEPINVDNIGKIIEEEIEDFASKMSNMGDEIKDEFDSKKKNFSASGSTASARKTAGEVRNAIATGLRVLGKTIKMVFGTVLQIWKPILFIVGAGLIIAFAVSWIASIIGLFVGFPFLNFVLPGNSAFSTGIISLNILFVIGIPLVAMILFVMRLFMGAQIKPVWRTGLWAFFAANIVCLFVNGVFTIKEFEHSFENTQLTRAGFVTGDTLTIDFLKNPYDDSIFEFGDEIHISGKKLSSENVYLHFEKAKNDDFRLEQKNYSRGKTRDIAQELAENIEYEFEIQDDKLIFPAHFAIEQPTKWRNQEVHFHIKVPEGKFIKYENRVSKFVESMQVDAAQDHPNYGRYAYWPIDGIPTWKMTKSGFISPEYAKKYKAKRSFDNKDFKILRVEGNVKMTVEKGDAFEIRVDGRDRYLKDLEIVQFGESLDIQYKNQHHGYHEGDLEISVTMPYLEKIALEKTNEALLKGFVQDKMNISLEGRHCDMRAYLEIKNLIIKQTGRHELDLRGKGDILNLDMDEYAEIDAEHYTTKVADVKAVNRNQIKLMVTDTIRKDVSPGSRFSHDGNPLVISNENKE